jgi:hypothetical protein
MKIITYLDDCIIVSDSIKDINTFIELMTDGPEEYVFTDKGDINKFLRIEIKEITRNKFELSQPFLIEWMIKLIGSGPNECKLHTNTKLTQVNKSLLNEDLEGKPCKNDWKYCTVIGMLTYLQGNTSPEKSMATRQSTHFCLDPKLSHVLGVMTLVKNVCFFNKKIIFWSTTHLCLSYAPANCGRKFDISGYCFATHILIFP